MEIRLKNLKTSEFASEETICFQADIWINGVKAGEAHNHGQGGATNFRHIDHVLMTEAEAYCNSLPNVESAIFGSLDMDLETFIFMIVEKMKDEKKFNAAIKKKILIKKPGDNHNVYEVGMKKGGTLTDAIVQRYQSENPTYKILNLMPIKEALIEYGVENYAPLWV